MLCRNRSSWSPMDFEATLHWIPPRWDGYRRYSEHILCWNDRRNNTIHPFCVSENQSCIRTDVYWRKNPGFQRETKECYYERNHGSDQRERNEFYYDCIEWVKCNNTPFILAWNFKWNIFWWFSNPAFAFAVLQVTHRVILQFCTFWPQGGCMIPLLSTVIIAEIVCILMLSHVQKNWDWNVSNFCI